MGVWLSGRARPTIPETLGFLLSTVGGVSPSCCLSPCIFPSSLLQMVPCTLGCHFQLLQSPNGFLRVLLLPRVRRRPDGNYLVMLKNIREMRQTVFTRIPFRNSTIGVKEE